MQKHRLSNRILDAEEQLFLDQLYEAANDETSSSPYPIFELSGSEAGALLLNRLGHYASLNMTARFERFNLVFPVEIHPDEFDRPQLHLMPPEIFEQGEGLMTRTWRVSVAENVTLSESSGEPKDVKIEDISLTGVSLSVPQDERLSKELDATLTLPSLDRTLSLHLCKVRQIDPTRIAYQIHFEHSASRALLRSFLFEQLRKRFPQLKGDDVVFQSSDDSPASR